MSARDMVVIGTSAGGVAALRQLVEGLPGDFPGSLCVVMHIGRHPSSLPAILSLAGALPAVHATHGMALEPGHIYVAPPDRHLLIDAGRLLLTQGPKEHHTRPAIDPLFRSAALWAGPRVVGVVLTGGLDDGVAGLQAIKACGGLAVVQDAQEAEDPGMPSAALRSVPVDHCVSLSELPALLNRLVREEAGPAVEPPARYVNEHLASLEGPHPMDHLPTFAQPSTLVCPDCGGALWEVRDADPPRFRCHTGHAFSLRSLTSVHSAAVEEALWAAVRVLQEKRELLRRIAELDRSAGDEAHARQAEQQAEGLDRQARSLRALAEGGTGIPRTSGRARSQ